MSYDIFFYILGSKNKVQNSRVPGIYELQILVDPDRAKDLASATYIYKAFPGC